MRLLRHTLVGTLVLVALSACSSGSDDASTDPTTDATTSATSTTESTDTTPTDDTTSSDQSSGAGVSGTGYSVAIPDGWEDVTDLAKQTNQAADVALAEPVKAGEFRTNFNTVTPNPIDASVTDAQLSAQAAKELKSVTQAAVTPLEAPDFDGSPALGQTSEAQAKGFKVTLVQYIVRHEDKVYAITMTFESKNAEAAQAKLDEIVGELAVGQQLRLPQPSRSARRPSRLRASSATRDSHSTSYDVATTPLRDVKSRLPPVAA